MLRYVAVIASLLSVATCAVAQNYAQRNVGVKAGILLVDSQRTNTVPSNFTPHVWFNLDSNRLAKPPGWNIYNPRASTEVTAQIQTRWTLLAGVANAPGVTETIGKRHGAYWEVPLTSAGDQEIADYDVLLLSARGTVSLTPTEREKLRRFVDQGGLLWVDFTGAATFDPINSFPLPFGENNAISGGTFAEYLHPILSYPNAMTEATLLAMETDTTAGMAFATVPAGLRQIIGAVEADSLRFHVVATTNRGPSIAVGKLGDGYMVVTTRGVATALNRIVVGSVYDPNTNYRALTPASDRSADAAANLVVNMIHLTSGRHQAGGQSRKSNSTPIDLWAPLLKRFNVTVGMGAVNETDRSPAIYKGVVVVTTPDRVMVFDAHPSADLDGDGNPDDGIQDYALGRFQDLLWQSAPLAGPISPATVVEVPDAISTPDEQILVVTSSGQMLGFDVFQLSPGGVIQPLTNAPPSFTVTAPGPNGTSFDLNLVAPGPYAPTVLEGMAYISDSQDPGLGNRVGRVWMADLRTGTRMSSAGDWMVGGTGGNSGTIPDLSASPTVGYLAVADNSGALDRVVYVPTRNVPSPSPTGAAGIQSIWAGVRGETIKPRDLQINPGLLTVTTRASLQGLRVYIPGAGVSHPLAPKISVVDPLGNPWDQTAMGNAFVGTCFESSPGVVNFQLTGAGSAALSVPNTRIVLDYTIDWGQPVIGPISPVVRGNVNLPDDLGKSRRIIGQIAMSPRGSIFAVHSGGTGGGSLFAFREEGRGQFRTVYRYELFNAHTITMNQAGSVNYREIFTDSDPVQTFPMAAPFISGPFRNINYRGGPTVRGDTVYVTANAVKTGFGVPMTLLMAFRAEPEPIQIRVGELPNNFSIVQPDLGRSNSKVAPEAFSTLQPGQYVYERDPGADTGTIRIDNMSSTTRGPIIHSLSTSQPIIIRRSGQPDLLMEPGATSNRWSPMLWFTVLHGMENSSSAFVSGETAFVGGSSMLPFILRNGTLGPPTGLLAGIDSTISATDPFLSSDTLRPWQKQLWSLKRPNATDVQPNPDIRWPQFGGVQSFEQWSVRYLQTTMAVGPCLGVVGGDGVLAAWQPSGVYAFSRADFLVADEGRLSRFDPSGNPIWSSDNTINAGTTDATSAGNVKPLVRPTRAYQVNANQMIVVDTGGDRIVRLDRTGKEVRSITGLKLDPTFKPDGYEPGEVLTLRQPRDVLMFTTYETAPASVSNPQPLEFWIHYVIADSGNKRLVELIDRYSADPVTRRIGGVIDQDTGTAVDNALGVLYWHSPAAFSGKNFVYTGVARVWNPATSRFVYAAGIGGAMPTRVDIGLDSPTTTTPREASAGNGGILVMDGANTTVVNQIALPAIGADVYWDEAMGAFNSAPRAARTKNIGGVNSVTMRLVDNGSGPQLAIMFTDESGVYEITPGSGTSGNVQWMMPNEAYRVLRRVGAPPGQGWLGTPSPTNPRDMRALYARRLDSGEILLVSGYQGLRRDGLPFAGEVIQLYGDPDPAGNTSTNNLDFGFSFNKYNFGFRTTSLTFELPPVQGTRGIVLPVFADRR